MSDVAGIASVAASVSNLRKARKRVVRALGPLGDRIARALEERNRAQREATSELTAELNALRCTLAALAVRDTDTAARKYLEDVAREGVNAYKTEERRRAEEARARQEAKGARMNPRPAPRARNPT